MKTVTSLLLAMMLCHFLFNPCAGADQAPTAFDGKCQLAREHQAAGRFPQAQADFEAALQVAGSGAQKVEARLGVAAAMMGQRQFAAAQAVLESAVAETEAGPDLVAQALVALSEAHGRQYKWQPAIAAVNKALAMEGVSPATRFRSQLALANIYTNYGNWAQVRDVCLAALAGSGYSDEQKVSTQQLLAKAHVNVREFAEARALMRRMLAEDADKVNAADQPAPGSVLQEYVAAKPMPATQRALLQMAIAKTLMLQREYAEARAEFVKALAMPGMTNALKAEAQLYVGLSYYEAGDDENARTELLKVPQMPDAWARPAWEGGRMGYVPAREATLRLQFRKLTPVDRPTLKVLFIGSSHTLRGDIPKLVTQLADSAPSDRPRILAGDYVYMGTNIATFWDAGDGPYTARGVIAGSPWDVVVFETFYNMKLPDLSKYVPPFVELIRSVGARPVIYASPLPKAAPYPDRFQQFHQDNLALCGPLGVALAPSVAAWARRLGPSPTEEQFGEVYADWIHASPAGAYITACCIYAAITGQSPVGLYHPPDLSDAQAAAYQQVAWETYLESNPAPAAAPTATQPAPR